MPDVKLFKPDQIGCAFQMPGEVANIERSLQTLGELDSETCLGVMSLANEYLTVKAHGWHIDTVALEHDCPMIIELEWSANEIVIREGSSAWLGFQA